MSKKPSTMFGTMDSGTKFTSLVKPKPFLNHQTDQLTDNDYKMQENQVASLNVHPLTLKAVVWPIHGHVWHSPWTLNQSQHGYLVVIFLDATSILQWLDHGEAISLFYITTDNNCLFAVAVACISKCVCK